MILLERSGVRRLGSLGAVVLTTVMSQIAAGLAAILIQWLDASLADLYAIGLQLSTISLNGLVYGVLYLVAIGRPSYNGWEHWRWAVALFSLLIGLLIVLIIAPMDGNLANSLIVVGCFTVGGAALAQDAVGAVKKACNGEPLPLARITIGPNIALILAVIVVQQSGRSVLVSLAPWVPAVVWAIASLLQSVYGRFRDSFVPLARGQERQLVSQPETIEHTAALVVDVMNRSVVPTLALTFLAGLAPGQTSLVFLASRIGGSLINVGINSVLLASYSWASEARTYISPARNTAATSLGLAMAGITTKLAFELDVVSYVLICLSWLVLSGIAAPITREMNAQRMTRSITVRVISELFILSIALMILYYAPSVTGYFAIIAVSQLMTILVYSLTLNDRFLAMLAVVQLPVFLLLVVFGW